MLRDVGAFVMPVVMAASFLVASGTPAPADPGGGPGARSSAPKQKAGTAAGRTHQATAAQTAAKGQVAPKTPPPAPKGVDAVGSEPRFPEPAQPKAVTPANGVTPVTEKTSPGVVAGSREITDRRSARSTVFSNPDGTQTMRFFSDTRYLPDADGDLQQTDTTLRRGADNRFTPRLAAKTSIASRADDPVLASVDIGGGARVGFTLEGADPVRASVSGDTAEFSEVAQGVDLRLTSLSDGIKEEIVLSGPDAPTSWRFPLLVEGLTPELASPQSGVLFKDGAGTVKAAIPAGFMTDSVIDPLTRRPTESRGVHYTLERAGSAWVLKVDVDRGWLRDPARKFPVTVDPSVRMISWVHDTYTNSDYQVDRSLDELMQVGTLAHQHTASYLTFDFWSKLSYKYILGASLNLYNDQSYPCAPAATTVYAVRQDWGYGVMRWPGKSYDSASPLVTATLPSKGCENPNGSTVGPGWHSFQLPRARFTRWAHGEDQPMYGFTVRQPAGSTSRWYHTSNSTITTARPYLDVTYADVGADYSLPNATFSPPVTATSKGKITVRIKKWGQAAWTPTNGYKLAAIVKNSAGAQLSRTLYPMPSTVEYGWNVDVPIQVGPVPVGTNYELKLTMVDPSNRDYDAHYSVPAGVQRFNVGNGPPLLAGRYPAHNGYVDKLRPALWADYDDPDNFPAGVAPKYAYRICNGTPQAPTGCRSSGWVTTAAWQVPAGVLTWGEASFWYVTLSDTQNNSPEYGPFHFTPLVAQPEVTSHLAGAPDDADVPGLNPQVGNYSTTTTDASVPAVGPALAIERTYNSQDPRSDGAFGPGWTSPLDQRLVMDGDGSENVVVTLSTGRTVRFGRSGDAFLPPPGMNLTLMPTAGATHGGWFLRDPSGQQRAFDDRGRLLSVQDSSGRRQSFTYNGTNTRPDRIEDEASGRSLWLTWAGNLLATVALDPPQAGVPAPTWTYTYDDGKLSRACSPLSATSCTSYTYMSSSHYRSVVLDDNPAAYWPLGGGAGNLDNVAARGSGENEATASQVLSGRPGPLAGSPDGALEFTGAADSHVALPDNLLSSSVAFSVELWFKAAAGKSGVLFGSQTVSVPAVPTSGWAPNLAVGTDGKLRGYVWAGASGDAMVSPSVVNDGRWHHAVLSVAVDRQTLYLDGTQIGQISGKVLNHFAMTRHHLGNGYTKNWPAASAGYFPFTGEIDEVAVFRHPLGAPQVAAHYGARVATPRLSTTTEPGAFTATTAAYDPTSGRVTAVTDRHGATWTLGVPAVQNRSRVVTLSSSVRDAITYTYDADHNGRLVARTDGFGTKTWTYNAAGFVNGYINPNGLWRRFFTDARGNRTADSAWYNGAWQYRYYGYESFPDNPLDPRNDQLRWASDGRDRTGSGEHWTWFYRDAKGRPTAVIRPKLPGEKDWTARRDLAYTAGTEAAVGGGTVPPGLIASETSFAGGTTRHYYNSAGDRVRTVDPVGLTTEVTYDAIGRPTTTRITGTVDGATVDYGTTTTTYNAASLPETVTSPAVTNPISQVTHTSHTRYTYDASGRTTQVDTSDTTGGDTTRTWKTGYDPAGHIISSTTPDGAVTTSEWDQSGNKVRETRPGSQVLEHRYDDRNTLVETATTGAGVDPMNPGASRMVLESRAYDPAGQLASVVDAMGRETAYTYYSNGLLETIKHVRRNPNGTIASTVLLEQNDYDPAGNVVRKTEAGGVVRDYLYDNLGNVIQEVLDPAGLMRSTSYQMRGDGQPSTAVSGNGLALGVDTPGEKALLATDNGSLIDDSNARYADAASSFTYRFALPSDTTGATFITDIANQFLVETSTNNSTWTKVLEETRDVRDGSNRAVRTIDLTPALAGGKTIYLRVRDSQPANGWGGRVRRSELRFQRAGAPAEGASFGYDAMGRTTTTTVTDPAVDPRALVTTIKRDPRGLQAAVTDPAGAVTAYGYDKAGRIERIVEPPRSVWRAGVATDNHSPTTVAGHNTFGEVTEHRDAAAGAITRTTRDAMGREIRRTLPAYTPPGGSPITPVERTDYDERGLPVKETDALGRITTHDHDKNGWLTHTTGPDPDGSGPKKAPLTQYKHNRLGEVLETVDPLGARHLATYDDRGNQITDTVTERSGETTYYFTSTLVPDDRGRTTAVTTPLNNTKTTTYNTADERVKTTDADGVSTEFRYSATGRTIAEIISGQRATGYGYDGLGRNTAITSHTVSNGVLSAPLRTSRTAYDRVGRVTRQTSAAGRPTDYTYDAGGQLRTITQLQDIGAPATAVTVKLDYDAAGRRTKMTDGNNNATEYHYNDWGSPTEVVEPPTQAHPAAADRTWTTVYDAAAQVTDVRMPGTVSIARTYDGLGRVTDETGSGAEGQTAARSFDYDAVGNVVSAGTPTGDNTYTWNDRGQLTNTSGPGGTAAFGYDSDGRLVTRADGAGSATFAYTGAGRLATATDPLVSTTLTYTYWATGDVQEISHGVGASFRTFGYDKLGRVSGTLLYKADGTQSARITYGYDDDDLLDSKLVSGVNGDADNNYGYDGLGRQRSWQRPDGSVEFYRYDKASNRTEVDTGTSRRIYAFDARNRLMTATGGSEPDLTNTWSARGSLRNSTQDGTTTSYTFDAFDQMLTAADPGYTVRYAYDSLGRVATRNGIAFGYADLGNSPVLVPGEGSAPRGKIFRDPESRPLSATLGDKAGRSLFQDPRHGDVRGWYDPADGDLERSAVYNPSGELVASSADPLPLGFQGGWSDSQTGLLNAHARWYNPETAGFTSRDTWTLAPDPVAQANRYGYGNASPLNNIDTDGHNPLALVGALFLGSNPVGWGVLAVVAVASAGYVAYRGYQSYQYHHNVTGSAGSWGGPATATRPATSVQNDYAARQDAAARAQAAANYQQAATQARINARVAEMTASYNQWVQAYLEAARADRARQAADQAARIEAERKAQAAELRAYEADLRAYNKQVAAQKAAAIKAATPGPVGTTVVKPPAAVALVGGGGVLTNIRSAVQSPGTVYASSDGADAPNAAAAAGAVAATTPLEIAGAGDPGGDPDGGCNDPRKIVEDTAKEVIEELGVSGIDKRISAAQWAHPEYIWAYRGSVVHKEVARRLGQNYPDLFDGTMNGKGPDYTVQTTGDKIELTTPGEVAKHRAKGGEYDNCGYALYDSLKK